MGSSDSPGQHAVAQEGMQPVFAQDTIERLFEFSPDAILIADGEGVMRAANPRVEELFGYSSQELIGQRVEMLVPARFRGNHPRHREDYNAAPRTRQMGAALNLFGLRKDGTEFPVDIMLKPIETAAGPAAMSFIRDATEQRAAQEALRLNDLRLRSIVESIGEYAIYLLDREGYILTWNPGAERIKGYKADEVLGLNFSRFFTQEDQERGEPAELLRRAVVMDRVEGRGVARAQGWFPLLGQHRAHGHPRQHRRGNGVRQGYPRRDRAKAGAGIGHLRAQQLVAGQCGHSQDA